MCNNTFCFLNDDIWHLYVCVCECQQFPDINKDVTVTATGSGEATVSVRDLSISYVTYC